MTKRVLFCFCNQYNADFWPPIVSSTELTGDIAYCVFQNRTKLVDPIDYESVIAKNKTLLQNDPQREMLLFPHDDVSVSRRSWCLSLCSIFFLIFSFFCCMIA